MENKIAMKNVQVRFSDDLYKGLERLSKEEGAALADVVRKSIQLYAIAAHYRKEGKVLLWEDRTTGERVELVIPGITLSEARQSA